MINALTTTSNGDRQMIVGATADHAARADVFADYQTRRAANTLRHQLGDLTAFAEYLAAVQFYPCLLYTSPSPRDGLLSRMPSSA